MNKNNLTKKELIAIVDMYERQIDLLDLILSDMSGISLEIVCKWLEDTYREINRVSQTKNNICNGIQTSFLGKEYEKEIL